MAILGFFEATVSINDQRAAEYDDDDVETKSPTNSKTVTKYVEAVAGTNFALDVAVKNDYAFDCDFLGSHVSLDGTTMVGRAIRSDEVDQFRVSRIKGVEGQENGQTTMRKFKFGDLAITDGESVSYLSEKKIKNLGTISIHVYRYELDRVETKNEFWRPISTQEEPVSEKALKGRAVTLKAGLDTAIPARANSSYIGDRLDDAPIASFHFKYRSRKALQQLLIIPLSPSPAPLDQRPIKELSAREARVLMRRQMESQKDQEQIKLEIKEEQENSAKRPRPEYTIIPSRSYKVARTEAGIEVVDLADDSDDETAPGPGNPPANDKNAKGNGNGVNIVDLEDSGSEED